MEIQATKVDKIGLLTSFSLKSSVDYYNSNIQTYRSSYGTSTKSSTRDHQMLDTVHYLSPATTRSAFTEYEGDLYYQQFVDFRKDLTEPIPGDFEASRTTSTISCEEPDLQRTLAIIKPDAMQYKDVVLRAINQSGLKILSDRTIHLSPEQVSEIYAKYYGCPSFPLMVVSVSVAPVMVLSLAGKNSVERWKTMVGPYGLLREEWFFAYSVRTRFGVISDIPDVIHASDNLPEAKWENRYFYPKSILEPIPTEEEKVIDYLGQYVNATLLEGLMHLVRVKPADPVLFLAEWLLLNNPFQPKFPERVALSPL